MSATIYYRVTTAVSGAPDPQPDLGLHAGPVAHLALQVSQVEALGTGS